MFRMGLHHSPIYAVDITLFKNKFGSFSGETIPALPAPATTPTPTKRPTPATTPAPTKRPATTPTPTKGPTTATAPTPTKGSATASPSSVSVPDNQSAAVPELNSEDYAGM